MTTFNVPVAFQPFHKVNKSRELERYPGLISIPKSLSLVVNSGDVKILFSRRKRLTLPVDFGFIKHTLMEVKRKHNQFFKLGKK
jgi:hypothetical protein